MSWIPDALDTSLRCSNRWVPWQVEVDQRGQGWQVQPLRSRVGAEHKRSHRLLLLPLIV